MLVLLLSLMMSGTPDYPGRVPWISLMDYPQALEAARNEGTVEFQLTFNLDGRVTECSIQKSSGTVLLDATVCRLSTRRARAQRGEARVQQYGHLWLAPASR